MKFLKITLPFLLGIIIFHCSNNTLAQTKDLQTSIEAQANADAKNNIHTQPKTNTEAGLTKTKLFPALTDTKRDHYKDNTNSEIIKTAQSPEINPPEPVLPQTVPLNTEFELSRRERLEKNIAFFALQDELFLSFAFVTAWGIHFWNWFSEPFSFGREYGFSQRSSTGGADNLGHAWSTYVLADFYNWSLQRKGWNKTRAALFGALYSMAIMTWIEIGDGFCRYGFAWEDIVSNFIGATLSGAKGVSPFLDELLDFRLQYWPTSEYAGSGELVADYSGMKFILATRMQAFAPIKRTPFRFIEWHVGYYTRGFRTFDKDISTNRVLYFGIGIDLKEFFVPLVPKPIKRPIDVALSYYQIPFTSWPLKKWEHKWSAE